MKEVRKLARHVGRKLTPQRTAFLRLAQSAEIGTVTRGQLIRLAQALPCLGFLNGTEAHLLVAVINTAPAESYDKDGRPIVFKSNAALAFEIGRSEGRVSRMLSRLYDAGVITMQDSGNYKRYPVRNADGSIADACGIDLRILIARFSELDGMVRQAKAEQNAFRANLRRYRGAVRARLALRRDAAGVSAALADAFTDEQTHASYYTAEIAVPLSEIKRIHDVRGADVLRPGMPVTVQIPVRKRTALQYAFEPMSGAVRRAFHEN